MRVQQKLQKCFLHELAFTKCHIPVCVQPFQSLDTWGPMTWKVSSAWMHVISSGSVPEMWHSSRQVWMHTDAVTCIRLTVTEVRLHLGLACAAHLHQLLPVLGECASVISYRLDIPLASCGLQSLEHSVIRVQLQQLTGPPHCYLVELTGQHNTRNVSTRYRERKIRVSC